MSETVRETLDRSMSEVSGGRSAQGDGRNLDRNPAYSNVRDDMARRDVVERAVAEHRPKVALQEKLDSARRTAAEARGFERQRQHLNGDPASTRMPTVRPDKNPTARESIYAALEEHRLPRQVVDRVDPIAGAVHTSIERAKSDPHAPPAHWNVDRREFQVLPQAIREQAHRGAPHVAEFMQVRNQLANPQTAPAAVAGLVQRFPLSEDQKREGWRRLTDPNRKAPALPQLAPGALPAGWTREAWMRTTPAVRAQALQEAQQSILWHHANKLISDPATRVDAFELLAHTYPHVANQYRQAYQQLPQDYQNSLNAERVVTSFAKERPHFETRIPLPNGGSVPVREVMGMMLQHDLALLQSGQQQQFRTIKANGEVDFDRAYDFIISQPNFPHRRRARGPSSMRSGAPGGASAPTPRDYEPQRGDSPRDSIRKAFAELRR